MAPGSRLHGSGLQLSSPDYNETNVTDNPGAKKLIAHCVLKWVECKAEHSKQSINIMFCKNASDNYLTPIVVHKVQSSYSE